MAAARVGRPCTDASTASPSSASAVISSPSRRTSVAGSRRSRLTGLPGAGVQDARDRIRPAVESAGLEWPLRRVVVNLSPGTLRKEGPGLDLPVAMGVLAATAQVPAAALGGWAFAGRAVAPGRPGPHPGRAVGRDRRGARGPAGRRRPGRERRRGRPGRRSRGRRRGLARGGGRVPAGDVAADRSRGDRSARGHEARRGSRGGPRSGAGPPGPRGRGGRRPQRPHGRSTRRGQDDARAPARHDPADDVARRVARGHPAALGGRPPGRRADPRAALPLAAPHGVARGAARRRHRVPAPGRGVARAPRGAVPGRVHGVPPRRGRGAASAPRGRSRRRHADGGLGRVPGAVHPRRRREPLPVRVRRRPGPAMHVSRRPAADLSGQAHGPAARPRRHPAGDPASHQARAARRTAGRVVVLGPRTRRAGPIAAASALRAASVSRATPSSPVPSRDARRGSRRTRASSSRRRSTSTRSRVAGSTARSRSRGRSRTSRERTSSNRTTSSRRSRTARPRRCRSSSVPSEARALGPWATWPPGYGSGDEDRRALFVLSALRGISPRNLIPIAVEQRFGGRHPRVDPRGPRRQRERPGVRARPGSRRDRPRRRGLRVAPRHVGLGRVPEPAPPDPRSARCDLPDRTSAARRDVGRRRRRRPALHRLGAGGRGSRSGAGWPWPVSRS